VNYFEDTRVQNGYNYRYAVCAYTHGTRVKPPLENPIATDPSIPGDNTVTVVPNAPLARHSLDSVQVVPNPYLVNAQWEKDLGVRRLDFTNLPANCTIRIYNMAGERVKPLTHSNGKSVESWNLLSDQQQEVAPGLYFYHLESSLGNKIGKFVIVY
jgi:hypothetical protein